MVEILAARRSLGSSTGFIAALLVAGWISSAGAQTDAGKGAKQDPAPKAAPSEKGAPPDNDPDDAVVETTKKQETTELFKDSRVEKALPNTGKQTTYPNPRLNRSEISGLRTMASNASAPDRALITKLVDHMVAELTSHTNIRAVIDPSPNQKPDAEPVRAIERATQELVDLYTTARLAKNEIFLREYIPILFAKLTPLLDNQLIPRVQASIVLATVATPDRIDFFAKLIRDPEQVVWVKLWSARAITNATADGRVTPDIVKATAAAAALVGLVENESDLPWPVKIRVYEALGCLHLASTTGPQGKPDVSALCFRTLSDSGEKVDVRSWASWAFGMIQVPAANARFNFPLASYQIGRLSAEIGEKIGQDCDRNSADFVHKSDYARYLTGLLLYQIYPSIAGQEGLTNFGLLNLRHPGIAPARTFVGGLDEQLKNVSKAANDLLTAGGVQVKERRSALGSRVAELSAFLAKNKPTDPELFPGGPKVDGLQAQVAGAPSRAK